MTTCPMCAEDVTPADVVCPHCGHLLRAAEPRAPSIRRQDSPAGVPSSGPSAFSSLSQWTAPVVMALLLVPAILIWFNTRPPDGPNETDPDRIRWWCTSSSAQPEYTCNRRREDCATLASLFVGDFRCVGRRVAWCHSDRATRSGLTSDCYGSRAKCEHERARSNRPNHLPCSEVGSDD